MPRYTIACILIGILFASSLQAAEDTTTEFKMRPIGHVQKTEGRTLIVLDKKYEPGLLGVDGYSHIYMIWWFDKNDTPKKRAVLQVHPMGNRENQRRTQTPTVRWTLGREERDEHHRECWRLKAALL